MDKKIAYGAETVMAQKNIGYFEEDMDDINEKSQHKFRDGIVARIVKVG